MKHLKRKDGTDMTDEEIMQKIEIQVAKKTSPGSKHKAKKKVRWDELYVQLRDEDLKRLGYIK